MPGLARKLLICAAVDGLIIQPLASKGQKTPVSAQVKYGGDATVRPVPRDQTLASTSSKPNTSFEAFGIVGIFTVARLSYLVSITGRQQVAQIRGHPVYVITDVAVTPCTTQTEAETAIRHTSLQLRTKSAEKHDDELSEAESEVEPPPSNVGVEETDDPGAQSDEDQPGKKAGEDSGIAEDVYKKSASYGRVAQRWFNNSAWMASRRRSLGLSAVGTSSAENVSKPEELGKGEDEDKELSKTVVKEKVEPPPAPSAGETLIPKLLRMAHIWFGTSKSFYFSYDLDLTRNLGNATTPNNNSPLHRSANTAFFWNQSMLKAFSVLSDESLLLPVMQGFVGQRTFVVDRNPPQMDSQLDALELNDMSPGSESRPNSPPVERSSLDLRSSEKKYAITVVSRRSIKRAGLRYLRRGIDDEGNTANSVETEQILSTPSWEPSSKVYSFVQVRGSIPLFFTQSPYSLKPVPMLQHSPEANYRAFSKHFDRMTETYGAVQLVNLVEKHGVESIVGNKYQENAEKYNEEKRDGSKPLSFEWFDFHNACRGMKFENVSLLLDTLGKKLEETGSTVETSGNVTKKQSGVVRTNCMDCLDRTNVCQSSFAKFMLDLQLKEEGFDMAAQPDQVNSWFNTLWADNGDAISKQYASTAAMKGDYTRTRKRDYRGLVNDLGLSLTRFYNGMVNDYFSQAGIDFFLGNVSSLVFDEFESTMMTKDPSVSMSKMRDLAIETSQKIAIEDAQEDFIGGWTLLSPHTSNSLRTVPFEEVVLLLTDTALYLCRFDWKLDKVSSFERVALSHVVGIKAGTYITSTMSKTQADEDKNVGIVITYEPGKTDVKRTNTRSLSSISKKNGNAEEAAPSSPTAVPGVLNQGLLSAISGPKAPRPPMRKIIALKALYAHTSISDARDVTKLSEREQVNVIAEEIERLVLKGRPPAPDTRAESEESETAGRKIDGEGEGEKGLIEKGDIISLAEAKRSTGVFEQLGHSIKKLVWA
ncbi:SacI homology domain-containing protein [Xylariaceae sp. FL1019]|nr:SacI homology domain-containing protein [Xylariaceae sp. FL1019]